MPGPSHLFFKVTFVATCLGVDELEAKGVVLLPVIALFCGSNLPSSRHSVSIVLMSQQLVVSGKCHKV